MDDFKRQPSKVWWSTYENEEDLPQFSGFLGWGKEVDLSSDMVEASELTKVKNSFNSSNLENKGAQEMSESYTGKNSGKVKDNNEESQRDDLESDRGNSSSPSQGSHKSQDSGFSDSEVQTNALSLTPQCSPELSGRTDCLKCKTKEESQVFKKDILEAEKSYNETVVNYRKLKTSVKTTEYKTNSNNQNYLETRFDDYIETPKKDSKSLEEKSEAGVGLDPQIISKVSSSKIKFQRQLIKSRISRTKCDTREKINQIQNQLELSFKLPKKINLSQNLKFSSLFSNPCHSSQGDSQNKKNISGSTKSLKENCSENVGSFKFSLSAKNKDTTTEKLESNAKVSWNCNKFICDSEGFKVPKVPNEQNNLCKISNSFLDFSEIGGPPVSSSTPKSNKFQGRESPVLKSDKVPESKFITKTTFATIRKLKGLPEKQSENTTNLSSTTNRCNSREHFSNQEKCSSDFESSVKHWLSELENMYEAEIMTTLQSKSLATDLTRQVTNLADTTSEIVRKLHHKTKIISLEFSKVCRQDKNKKEKHIVPIVQSLISHVIEFIQEYVQKNDLVPQNINLSRQKNERKEEENCHELITDFRQAEPATVAVSKETETINSKNNVFQTKEEEVLEKCEQLRTVINEKKLDLEKLEVEVSKLGQSFKEVVDILLESHIQALVHVLEEPKTELALRTALSALTSLGLEGNHLSHLVCKCGGIRALLAVCLEGRATAVRVSALRALATVCCVSETIRQFEQAGGVEIMSDILADEKRSEIELSEASAVVAQITAPWVQDNHSVEGLTQFLGTLVTSLTRIVSKYKSSETLLLSSAALANLTFMEPRTVWPLLENETAKILLTAVRRQGPKVSVFIQEQAATVIANMASVPECRKHLAEERAVVALLCFLQIQHSALQRQPEVSAAERLQQKSAIALSRLCSDATVAKQVIELQGVNRLVRLCKEERERNHSDGVLVACLAALRKIVANCGTESLEELNAMELVEPRLLDSFLLYSSKQESYV